MDISEKLLRKDIQYAELLYENSLYIILQHRSFDQQISKSISFPFHLDDSSVIMM